MSKKIKPVDALEMRRLAAKAELVKALAHPLRLAIIEFLSGGERCVCEIAELAGAERSNISRHLALMVRAGVLFNRKQGLQVYYRLRCQCVAHFLECATDLLNERVSEDAELILSSPRRTQRTAGGEKRKRQRQDKITGLTRY